MQTIDEVKEHCRFVGEGIEKMVADDEDINAQFEGTQIIRFKVEKDGNDVSSAARWMATIRTLSFPKAASRRSTWAR